MGPIVKSKKYVPEVHVGATHPSCHCRGYLLSALVWGHIRVLAPLPSSITSFQFFNFPFPLCFLLLLSIAIPVGSSKSSFYFLSVDNPQIPILYVLVHSNFQ